MSQRDRTLGPAPREGTKSHRVWQAIAHADPSERGPMDMDATYPLHGSYSTGPIHKNQLRFDPDGILIGYVDESHGCGRTLPITETLRTPCSCEIRRAENAALAEIDRWWQSLEDRGFDLVVRWNRSEPANSIIHHIKCPTLRAATNLTKYMAVRKPPEGVRHCRTCAGWTGWTETQS